MNRMRHAIEALIREGEGYAITEQDFWDFKAIIAAEDGVEHHRHKDGTPCVNPTCKRAQMPRVQYEKWLADQKLARLNEEHEDAMRKWEEELAKPLPWVLHVPVTLTSSTEGLGAAFWSAEVADFQLAYRVQGERIADLLVELKEAIRSEFPDDENMVVELHPRRGG